MITWLEPTVRGQMLFTASESTAVAGYTSQQQTTIDVTQTIIRGSTTVSGTANSGAPPNIFTVATSDSYSSATTISKTLQGQTTYTTTSPAAFYITTDTTQTFSTHTTTTLTGDPSFTFTTATQTRTLQTSDFATTQTTITTTSLRSDTVVANVFDTVVLCDVSEVAMCLTSLLLVENWNEEGMVPQGTTTGTKLTISAPVTNSSVFLLQHPHSSVGVIEEVSESTSFTFWESKEAETFSSTVYNFAALPNTSYTVERRRYLWTESQASYTLFYGASFQHSGNTKTAATALMWTRPTFAIDSDGETFFSGEFPDSHTIKTVTVSCDYWFMPSGASAGGNTTYLQTAPYVGLYLLGETDFDFGAGYQTNSPAICYVVRPYGVVNQGQSGAFFTINNTTINKAHPAACLSRQAPFMNFDNARAIRALTTTSNADFTLSGNSLTYTVTGSQKTASQQVSVSGEYSTGIVATKSVLGGSPQASETFYQCCHRGLYKDALGETVTKNGEHTSFEYPNSLATGVLLNVPFMSVYENPPPLGVPGGYFNRMILTFNNQQIPTHTPNLFEQN